jgi:hypothetical protein
MEHPLTRELNKGATAVTVVSSDAKTKRLIAVCDYCY